MANRVFKLKSDIAVPPITVDLNPPFEDMELSFAELEVFQYDTVTLNFVITQNGQPFDLTGYSLVYNAKLAISDTSLVFSESATMAAPKTGQAQVVLSAADLGGAGTLQTQLYMSIGGVTQTVMQVPLVVQPSV